MSQPSNADSVISICMMTGLSCQGIVVKVLHEKLGEKYYKRKGMVVEVRDTYTGIVRMLDTNDKIKIDQSHLETVIPAIGNTKMGGEGEGETPAI